jgi:hypothetical protein
MVMVWGNNVFSYDRALLVRAFGPFSRSLEQLGGIAQGVYPGIRILAEPDNQRQVEAIHRVRSHLLFVGADGSCCAVGTADFSRRLVERAGGLGCGANREHEGLTKRGRLLSMATHCRPSASSGRCHRRPAAWRTNASNWFACCAEEGVQVELVRTNSPLSTGLGWAPAVIRAGFVCCRIFCISGRPPDGRG